MKVLNDVLVMDLKEHLNLGIEIVHHFHCFLLEFTVNYVLHGTPGSVTQSSYASKPFSRRNAFSFEKFLIAFSFSIFSCEK